MVWGGSHEPRNILAKNNVDSTQGIDFIRVQDGPGPFDRRNEGNDARSAWLEDPGYSKSIPKHSMYAIYAYIDPPNHPN